MRPRIPSSDENRASLAHIERLIRTASQRADDGRASLAVVVGNGLSQLDLDYFKDRMSALLRLEQKGQLTSHESDSKRAAILASAWQFFERWRLGTWNCRPSESTGLALLLQWIFAGFTRLVFSSNYDLFLESLLLRWPEPALPPSPLLVNPFVPMPDQQAPRARRRLHEPRALTRDSPVRLCKYNGNTAFVVFETLDWNIGARLGSMRQAVPGLRSGQVVTMKDIRASLGHVDWGRLHPWDRPRSRFLQACHYVDAIAPSDLFLEVRDGARALFENHAEQLLGVVVLGQWGQDGEALNDQILRFAGSTGKTVVQILWYPPSEKDYQRCRPSLWSALPEGSRHLLVRDHYDRAPGGSTSGNDAGATARPQLPHVVRVQRQEALRAIGRFAGPKQPAVRTIEGRLKAANVWLTDEAHKYDGEKAGDYERLLRSFDGS